MPVEITYSDAELLDVLRDAARAAGRTPGRAVLDRHAGYSVTQTIIGRFGTYNRAVKLAGLTPNVRRGGGEQTYSEEAVRRAYWRIRANYGRKPSLGEWNRDRRPDEPASVTLRKRYGSWPAFHRAMLDQLRAPQ